jgi:hypothetical protein
MFKRVQRKKGKEIRWENTFKNSIPGRSCFTSNPLIDCPIVITKEGSLYHSTSSYQFAGSFSSTLFEKV